MIIARAGYVLRFTLVNDGFCTYHNYPYRSKLVHLYSQFLASNSHLRPEVVFGECLRKTWNHPSTGKKVKISPGPMSTKIFVKDVKLLLLHSIFFIGITSIYNFVLCKDIISYTISNFELSFWVDDKSRFASFIDSLSLEGKGGLIFVKQRLGASQLARFLTTKG